MAVQTTRGPAAPARAIAAPAPPAEPLADFNRHVAQAVQYRRTGV